MIVYKTKEKGFYALDIPELVLEIEVRKELIQKCVGTLYPSILWDEIETIHTRIDEIKSHTS